MQPLIRASLVLLGAFTLLTGLAYPLLLTAAAQGLFPSQANGSLLVRDGRVEGSALIGQPLDDPRWFWSRPSATAPFRTTARLPRAATSGPATPRWRTR